jgi:hypothetical protein
MFADLNPCGFYLWGIFKDKVSNNNPCNENNFEKHHSGCRVSVSSAKLGCVITSIFVRCHNYLWAKENHFNYLL